MEVEVGITKLRVSHEGGKLTFQYPAFRGNYGNVANAINNDNLKRPNSSETASLVYDAFKNSDGKYLGTIGKVGGCPCLHTVPCSPQCSCATPVMSGGCSRCCNYGSAEQRHEQAERLTHNHDAAIKAAEIAALEWAAKTAERLSETTHWDDPSAGIVAEIRSEIERKKGGGE